LDRRTLLYLASDPDGSGPFIYSMDVERRVPHKLTDGPEFYTSLVATADGRRLVGTVASPKRSLSWVQTADSTTAKVSPPLPISLTTSTGFSPRLGPNFLLYVSLTGTGESIWKLVNGSSRELWSGDGARIIGAPAISSDGQRVAFSVRQHGRSLLYVMQADGTNTRIVSSSLNLQGAPAWTPDGHSVTSAAEENGTPHLFRISLDGRSVTRLIREYSLDPAWRPDGRSVLYFGPDIATTFSINAVGTEATAHSSPVLTLNRGAARHLAFLPDGKTILFLQGDMQHKNVWRRDLETGGERQITNFDPDFHVRDFDISPDGREMVVERVQERSDVVLIDLPKR